MPKKGKNRNRKFSFSIPEDLHKKMQGRKEINWSAFLRKSIEEKLAEKTAR